VRGDTDWSLVAAQYAATGRADVTLQALAASAGVGLVQVAADGSVTWSDETYRLHGRPRWRRVRSVTDALAGVGGAQARQVGAAYAGLRTEAVQPDSATPDAITHDAITYAATPELGEPRALVLRRLGPGLALVHRAGDRDATEQAPEADAPPTVVSLADRRHDTTRSETELPDHDRSGTGRSDDASSGEQVESHEAAEPPDSAATPIESATEEPTEDESSHLAAAVLAASPDLVVVYDVAADAVVRVAGSSPDADDVFAHLRAGDFVRARVHPSDRETVLAWRRSLDTIGPEDVLGTEARFLMGGQWRWQEIRALDFAHDETRHEVLFHIRDVHDRVEAVARLTARERAFREVFDSSPVGLAVLDADGRFHTVNDAFCRLVGRTQDALSATSIEALLHPEDRGARRRSGGGPTTATELRLVRSDGAVMWVRMRSSDISVEEGDRVLVSIEDVTSSKAHEDRLRHDALHDDLTGLPNRRLIEDRLERALARSRRTAAPMAVFFIDLDGLKQVNDTHPWRHRAGDVLITTVADALRASLRDTDTLGRLGGDEFVAICDDVADRAMIDEIGERLLAAAREPITIGDETVRTSVSVGVATPEDPDETAMQLLSRADAAMYRAKRAGGSRVVSADTLPPAAAALEEALDAGLLRLHYRPVVSLATGTLLGVEARIRWAPGAEALPAEDVRAALETGPALLPVVHWAVARAVADVRTVAPSRTDHLSVWLSLPCRAALAGSTRTAFEEAFAGPRRDQDADSAPSIVVDVDEDELTSVGRRDSLHRHLDDLVAAGPVSIGIDGFSADSVPLGLMRTLGVASVTLAPDLLHRAAADAVDRDLVRSLVTAAGALGVVTVADDVDSPEDLELCRGLGLHAAKGDLVGPFSPLETYSDLLHAGLVPLPESFDPRTHDALTGDPLAALPAALAAAPPTTEPALGQTDEGADDRDSELAESDLLSRDVLAAIRWLDELDRTAQERVQAATEHDAAAPTAATAPAPTAPSPGIPEPSAALDAVPALAPLEPPPPAPRMPGLDLVEPAAEVAPPPALWAAAAPTTEPAAEPVAEPAPPAEPVQQVEPVPQPAEDLVIELRDAPVDIGAALAAELGVDLTPFDAKVGAMAEAPGAAAPSAPVPPVPGPSPFAGMTLPPSPFLRPNAGT
jgi:diguanylate cyclase (GGDEF)-like protein/PAS domain S-box-containing protein